MKKSNNQILNYIEGERVCTKIGGGFGTGQYNPVVGELPLIEGNYESVSYRIWHMVENFRNCTQGPEITINEHLNPCHNYGNENENLQYFYHPDHLGSSSFITNAFGYAEQHIQYMPFGEIFVNQQNSAFDARYTFSAKEKDNETSYSYFGARYMDSELSVWLSVDPFTDDYPSESGYMYCGGNPVYYKDIDGNFKFPTAADEQSFAEAYPTFYNYIKNTDAASGSIMDMAKSQRVVNALIDNSAAESKLTLEKIIEDFTYNQGNTIYLSENESYNVDKTGDIYLSKNMLQSVEDALKNNDNTAATGAMTWSVSTLIHEYLENFSDDIIMTANNTPTDKGCIEMERDVWGHNLFSVEDGIRSVNMRNGTLIDEKTLQIIIDMSVIPVFESNTDK